MIVILKKTAGDEAVKRLTETFKKKGISSSLIIGENQTILGLVGDTSVIDMDNLYAHDCVEDVRRVQEPYKKANRNFHPDNSIIRAGNVMIGDGSLQIIAGPCSVENESQIIETAIACKKAGASMLRGGAYKPRTSPYAFQGLGEEGIKLLLKAKAETGLPIVTEIMSYTDLDFFADVDVIQVGARNMQNFQLLKALGKCGKPVLLKRGLSNTIEELLMSAEYIMSEGNENIILCERGIRTFETMTRNTLDVAAVPLIKRKSHLPVCVDPSHASGLVYLIAPLSLAAIAAGADALEIEVHSDPKSALSDGGQQLNSVQFEEVMKEIKSLCGYFGRKIG